jgi:hypothetical protein
MDYYCILKTHTGNISAFISSEHEVERMANRHLGTLWVYDADGDKDEEDAFLDCANSHSNELYEEALVLVSNFVNRRQS